jgi:hypothetical protein
MPLYPIVPDLPGVPPIARSSVNALGQLASGQGTIRDTTLTVSQLVGAALNPGQFLSGAGLASGIQIVAQLAGDTGGLGDYQLSQAANVAGLAFGTSNFFTATLATLDGIGSAVIGGAVGAQPQWGIFDDAGHRVIAPDSVVDFELRAEQRIAIFPIEKGSFGSYNKVTMPFEARMKMNRAGTASDRTDFLNACDTALRSFSLYTAVTPEVTYDNASIEHYDYRRTSENGVQLITVEMWLQEVRVAASPTFSNTQQPQGQDAAPDGAVQPQVPTAQQSGQASAALAANGPLGGIGGPPGDD